MKSTLIYLFIAIAAFTALKLRHADVEPNDLKEIIIESCKENDSESCVSAVNQQFDGCLKRYQNDWDKFMKSSGSELDHIVNVLGVKISACIVDEDGEPFFTFDDEEDES